MDPSFLGRGLLIGIAIAAPVGAIGLLCIRRTLVDGRLTGFVTGLGAATADGLYGMVAAFGVTSVSSALTDQRRAIGIAGGVLLCWLGWRTAVAHPSRQIDTARQPHILGAYGSTLLLTLMNPSTILSFAAVFAGLGLADGAGRREAAISLVAGVFLGSAAWWLLLTAIVGTFRQVVTPPRLVWVNRAAGAMLIAFGLLALIDGLRS